MRVISGKAKGITLESIPGLTTRPTTDRVKEAVFSSIQFELQSAVWLDLFAGSGAMGIEALSRGAEKAFFVDQSPEAIQQVLKNLKATKLIQNAIVKQGLVDQVLSSLKTQDMRFDIIFMDPPYGLGLCHETMLQLVSLEVLTDTTIVVVEHDKSEPLLEEYGKLVRVKTKKYGKILISTYRGGTY